jgi:hypothetical protein
VVGHHLLGKLLLLGVTLLLRKRGRGNLEHIAICGFLDEISHGRTNAERRINARSLANGLRPRRPSDENAAQCDH